MLRNVLIVVLVVLSTMILFVQCDVTDVDGVDRTEGFGIPDFRLVLPFHMIGGLLMGRSQCYLFDH